jgi:endonuclease G
LPLTSAGDSGVREVQYDGFTVWVDCAHRGPVRFEYRATRDTGKLARKHSFALDTDFPSECQQISSDTYSTDGPIFDRGHMVPANHLDHLAKGISQSNFMTNVLPQARTMNRGAWLRTEEIIECVRDQEDLRVIGGVVWGRNPDDDYFIDTHGVETPDYYWKVVIGQGRAIAWLVPNSAGAKRSRLDRYLISIRDLEAFLHDQEIFADLADDLKSNGPVHSWPIPSGCDKS